MSQQFPDVDSDTDTGADPSFSILILAATCYAWSFSRHELARVIGLSVEEADDRFVRAVSRMSELSLKAVQERIRLNAESQTSRHPA